MTFITENHSPRLPALYDYAKHVDSVLGKKEPVKGAPGLRERIRAALGKVKRGKG